MAWDTLSHPADSKLGTRPGYWTILGTFARAYLEDIAELVDGFIPEHESPGEWSVKVGSRTLNIEDLLGKEEAYLEIVDRFLERIRKVVESK